MASMLYGLGEGAGSRITDRIFVQIDHLKEEDARPLQNFFGQSCDPGISLYVYVR